MTFLDAHASLYLLVPACPPGRLPVPVSLRIVNATSTSHNPPHCLPDIIRRMEQSTECALPFPSAISQFKICARMNQSLFPPFTGAEIVKARLR